MITAILVRCFVDFIIHMMIAESFECEQFGGDLPAQFVHARDVGRFNSIWFCAIERQSAVILDGVHYRLSLRHPESCANLKHSIRYY